MRMAHKLTCVCMLLVAAMLFAASPATAPVESDARDILIDQIMRGGYAVRTRAMFYAMKYVNSDAKIRQAVLHLCMVGSNRQTLTNVVKVDDAIVKEYIDGIKAFRENGEKDDPLRRAMLEGSLELFASLGSKALAAESLIREYLAEADISEKQKICCYITLGAIGKASDDELKLIAEKINNGGEDQEAAIWFIGCLDDNSWVNDSIRKSLLTLLRAETKRWDGHEREIAEKRENEFLRVGAAHALGTMGAKVDKDVLAALDADYEIAAKQEFYINTFLAESCLLASLKSDKEMVRKLVKFLDSKHVVREFCYMEYIPMRGASDKKIMAYLVDMLNDSDPKIVANAIPWIGRCGPFAIAAKPMLEEIIANERDAGRLTTTNVAVAPESLAKRAAMALADVAMMDKDVLSSLELVRTTVYYELDYVKELDETIKMVQAVESQMAAEKKGPVETHPASLSQPATGEVKVR